MNQENNTKIFDDSIRRYFDEDSRKWYFSIVDIIGIVAKSSDARNYWKVLKNRLKKAQNQLVTECNQLKMQAGDGKFYFNDVADADTMLKIIELISEQKIPLFLDWFDAFRYQKGPNMLSLKKTVSLPEKLTNEPDNLNQETYPQFEEKEVEFELGIDMYKSSDNIVIKAFVAGSNIKNLSLDLTPLSLEISGERKKLEKESIEEFHERELAWGKFSRFIDLPLEVETQNIEATEMHGMLTIKLPILDTTRTKKIKINFS